MAAPHILFISSWYPNPSDPNHGIFNRQFAHCASRIARVSVLHVSPDPALSAGITLTRGNEEGLFVVRAYYPPSGNLPHIFSKIIQHFRRRRAYRRGFRTLVSEAGRPDLIHLNVIYPAGAGALMLSKKYKLPLLVNECWTGYDPSDGRYRGLVLKALAKRVVKRATIIAPVSTYLRDLMLKHGLRGKYEVVPNVVNEEVFAPANNKSARFTFIHISALDDEQKNVSGILRAFHLSLRERPEMHLEIVGGGAALDSLKKIAAQLGIEESVSFAGRLDPAEVSHHLSYAHALVMFSNYETLCLAVPEALSCGIPVVTSEAGGIMSYFRADLGITVPCRNEEALCRALVTMYDTQGSYSAQHLREFAVENFGTQVVTEKLRTVYNRILATA